ncbi:reverse transcriptase domain-containing protein [Nitrosococcus halophilus]|uniref:reverse transcriptase domain-containing protein n=1 Tax=Nitrosococcus halophilus TaxID=133539 RepID=UPI000A078F18
MRGRFHREIPLLGNIVGRVLSPFLSNVVLDELDQELERRGHYFVRYGDDCNVYVKSQRAGERVMDSLRRFITGRLKLKVNEAKSAVDVPQKRQFLGFIFTAGRWPNRRKIAPESLQRFKARVRQLTKRNWSISLEERVDRLARYLRGWKAYFGFCPGGAAPCHDQALAFTGDHKCALGMYLDFRETMTHHVAPGPMGGGFAAIQQSCLGKQHRP